MFLAIRNSDGVAKTLANLALVTQDAEEFDEAQAQLDQANRGVPAHR